MRIILVLFAFLNFISCQTSKRGRVNIDSSEDKNCKELFSQIKNKTLIDNHFYIVSFNEDSLFSKALPNRCFASFTPEQIINQFGKPNAKYDLFHLYGNDNDSCFVYHICNDKKKYEIKVIDEHVTVTKPHVAESTKYSYYDTCIINKPKSLVFKFKNGKCFGAFYISPKGKESIGKSENK